MRWIETTGGPLILMPAAIVRAWGGIDFRSDRPNSSDPPPEVGAAAPASDYERACAVADYLGVVRVGVEIAIVLGDMPLRTTWFPDSDGEGGSLVRWLAAQNESVVLRFADNFRDLEAGEPQLEYALRSPPLLLFDASQPGTSVEEALELELPPGPYTVCTAVFNPDPETTLIVHRWQRQ